MLAQRAFISAFLIAIVLPGSSLARRTAGRLLPELQPAPQALLI
jgi:hypothetical protein